MNFRTKNIDCDPNFHQFSDKSSITFWHYRFKVFCHIKVHYVAILSILTNFQFCSIFVPFFNFVYYVPIFFSFFFDILNSKFSVKSKSILQQCEFLDKKCRFGTVCSLVAGLAVGWPWKAALFEGESQRGAWPLTHAIV